MGTPAPIIHNTTSVGVGATTGQSDNIYQANFIILDKPDSNILSVRNFLSLDFLG